MLMQYFSTLKCRSKTDETANEILNINPNISIIFVTAYNQYAVEAFEINALDYILKPLTGRRLDKSIERIKGSIKPKKNLQNPFIKCFYGFDVFVDDKAIVWKNQKAKEILAFLIHNKGRSISWEKITDAIWEDCDYEKAHANFHTTMYRLRKTLSEYGIDEILECGRGNYRINTDMVRCDLFELSGNSKNKGYMEEEGYMWAYFR